jgi:hypothetical protein
MNRPTSIFDAGEDSCRFWLHPVRIAYNDGMRPGELRDLKRIVLEHREEFERKWHEYFG